MGFKQNRHFFYGLILVFSLTNTSLYSQTKIEKNGLEYVITTAVPFMRIASDARSSGMAEVGVSTSADYNSGFHNPAKLAFIENDFGATINFAPWLRQITNDIYLINANGYSKINENSVFGLGIRYFTLGSIVYKDALNNNLGEAKPYELCLEAHYAIRLSEQLSLGTSGRYIMSDLSNGATAPATRIPVGRAFAVDLGLFYSTRLERLDRFRDARLNIGLNLSNIGTKIKYTDISQPDYIPTNLSLGTTFSADVDEYNSFNATLQFDKLMVPTPQYEPAGAGLLKFKDRNNNGTADYREYESISGMLVSFGDHGDGVMGELSEIITHLGAEYAYQKTYIVRAGFYYEPEGAGGRQYMTAGLGMKFNTLKLDFSYLLPITQQKSPLDNQIRVSLGFNLGDKKKSGYW